MGGVVGWADLPIIHALSSVHREGLLVDIVHRGYKACLAVACQATTCRHKRLLLASLRIKSSSAVSEETFTNEGRRKSQG